MGEFGGVTEAAVGGIKLIFQAFQRLTQCAVNIQPGASSRRCRIETGQGALERRFMTRQIIMFLPVMGGDSLQQLTKARHAVAGIRWKVRAGENRCVPLGCQGHGQRPATRSAGQYLVSALVDPVEIRSFLTIHLDADKMLVHQRRDSVVLKGFMGHDMAPVTGGITDGEQDGFVFVSGQSNGLFVPRMPVHGIIGMLEQVRAVGGIESVGHGS